MSKHYKIGTRGSLLAVTQCTLIKNEITQRTGDTFELELIKTQGDQQTEKPLWQMDGKDFFTKELDTALLANDVDLVVHSYKDLGSDRPNGIGLATITERKYAHDILLIKKENIAKIKELDKFIVGTSSPRRIVNVESSLKDFLPEASDKLEVKCEMLRGNVNTRIQKLRDDNYHAIVLALAGLERLANKEESKKELAQLLEGLTFMVMPQKAFPSSASQGALAIEYNSIRADEDLYKTLRSVHCETTEQEMKRERAAFQSYGGGCHLAVGIHVRKHKNLFLHIEKGEHQDKKIHKVFLEGVDYSKIEGKTSYLVLGDKDVLINKENINVNIPANTNVFVTSKYCIDALKGVKTASVWSSGIMTSKRLAKAGHWLNGSAEGLGHEEIARLSQSKAVQMMLDGDKWNVLTHDQASSPLGDVTACYKRVQTNAEFNNDAEILFWSSFYQYQVYTNKYPELKNRIHACGLGKTYDQFLDQGIEVYPFPDMDSFRSMTKEV
jgi:hydroxymethylbilane synthase